MNYAVILAGGRGVRFWPLSRQEEPKQLLKIFGNYSLLQHTYLRISKIVSPANVYVVTNKDYAETIRYQLKELGFCLENVIVEISPKNTAASIGLAAKIIQEKDKDGVMAVFPADHFIKKEKIFLRILQKAFTLAGSNLMFIFGIKPLRPESAYGYIKVNKKIPTLRRCAFKVERFIEKPNKSLAAKLIKDGGVYWNGGIFVWKVSILLEQIKKFMPELHSVLNESDKKLLIKKWSSLKSISIDYGIMEKCKDDMLCRWIAVGQIWATGIL